MLLATADLRSSVGAYKHHSDRAFQTKSILMCYQDNPSEMAGLSGLHRDGILPETFVEESIVDDVYSALTKNLNPHLPALPALVAMIEALREEDYGVLGEFNLVRLPLSIVGADKVRYRTQVVDWLHETILSLRMSDLTIDAVQDVLREHNLCVFFQCSCGVVMGRCDDVRRYHGGDHHERMDALRSAIDADGNRVERVDNLEDIPVRTMDLHHCGAERRLLDRVESLIKLAAGPRPQFSWLDDELQEFVSDAQNTFNPDEPEGKSDSVTQDGCGLVVAAA